MNKKVSTVTIKPEIQNSITQFLIQKMNASLLFSIIIIEVCSFVELGQGQTMLEMSRKQYTNQYLYQNPWQIDQNTNQIDKRNLENNSTTSTNCCTNYPCPNPCFQASAFPMSPPIIVPARTVFEPVLHHHPPLEKIRRIIKRDKRRRRRRRESSSRSSSSEFSSSIESDTDSDWY